MVVEKVVVVEVMIVVVVELVLKLFQKYSCKTNQLPNYVPKAQLYNVNKI